MTITENTAPSGLPLAGTMRPIVGIHLNLTDPQALTGLAREHVLLSHVLTGQLRRLGLLREGAEFGNDRKLFSNGRLLLVAFEREIFGFAPVTDNSLALRVIADELAAVELLPFAHLAWIDHQKGVWATSHPVPEPMPFERHVDAFLGWQSESPESRRARLIKCAQKAAQLLEDIGNEESPLAP